MKGIDQPVDGGRCILFGDVGQLSIACGGGGAGMAEDDLNMAKA